MTRSSFANVVRYVLDKEKDARIIAVCDVLAKDSGSIIRTFEAQARTNSRLKNKVGHIALSFSPNDKDRCTDEFMCQVAGEYLKKMGIVNTQFFIARHSDHEHPHMHIVYNRVDNSGKTVSDKNQRYKNKKVCLDLTKEYKLFMGKGKEYVNRDRLRQPDKSKYHIYDVIRSVLPNCYTWKDFCKTLAAEHIDAELVKKGSTNDVQGAIFVFDGYRFSGSKIDREFSYSKLQKRLIRNRQNMKKRNTLARQTTHATGHNIGNKAGRSYRRGNLRSVLSPSAPGYSRNAEYEIDSSGYDDIDNERKHYQIHY